MNRLDLARELAVRGYARSGPVALDVIDGMLQVIKEELAKGGEVNLPALGIFRMKHRPATRKYNVSTKLVTEVPASTKLELRPSLAFQRDMDKWTGEAQ